MSDKILERVERIGAWAEVSMIPGREDELRRRLTLTVKDSEVRLKQYMNHPRDHSRLFIPRALASKVGLPIEGSWPELGCTSKLTSPREGQKEAIDLFLNALKSDSPYGGIMQAVTGAGKTVMALDIACQLGLKTLIVVPRSSLVEQWRLQIMKWTDCDEDDIGLIQGSKRIYKNKKFTIAMIHTLAQQFDKYENEIFHAFGTVIFDECHVVGAETFSLTAPLFRSRWRIGLSATPRRADEMDQVFYWHIGQVVSRFAKLQAKARVRVIKYHGHDTGHEGCIWAGKLNLGRYLNRVVKSQPRLQLLANCVNTLNENQHDILVLSDRISHLRALRLKILEMGVKSEDIGFLIGGQKDLTKRIILGTYGSAGMGVDIPRLSALVLATPRADIEQAVGRVLRQGTPFIVDIADTYSHIMQAWGAKRAKYYRKITDNIQESK